MTSVEKPAAVVMNMFDTGLGIARSLGEQGISVIGLSTRRLHYGNFTRYANVRICPDSRNDPEALLKFLLALSTQLDSKALIFPTRDDDIVFLDRFRVQLERHYVSTIPASSVIEACLNKWETYKCALEAEVATPKCWLVTKQRDLFLVADEVTFPCVMKPVLAHHWRQGENWKIVGGRKAIEVRSRDQLLAEYSRVEQADHRVLVQEFIPGGDNGLVVAACYFDQNSNCVAAFNSRKLLQVPEGFGTGCVVQSATCHEVLEPTIRLLKQMRFTGIAEVEYKWDAKKKEFALIEINPRSWDQHRLGNACGVDVIQAAYRERAGLRLPTPKPRPLSVKWISEGTFFISLLQSIARRDRSASGLLQLVRGKRIYSIWLAKDPLPFFVYLSTCLAPQLTSAFIRGTWKAIKHSISRKTLLDSADLVRERNLEK